MEKKKKAVIAAAIAAVILAGAAIAVVVMHSSGSIGGSNSGTETTTTLPIDATMDIAEEVTSTVAAQEVSLTSETTTTTTETTTTEAVTTSIAVETKRIEDIAEPIEYSSEESSDDLVEATVPEFKTLTVENLSISTISVSCLSISWDTEEYRAYEVEVTADAEYADNIYFNFTGNSQCYLTGLRENSEYAITVTPLLSDDEDEAYFEIESASGTGYTESTTVLNEYEIPEGQTNHFLAAEKSVLLMPDIIGGTIADPVTETGINRNAYGDYCCNVPEVYGNIGDRLLIELESGEQFTVTVCGNMADAVSDNEADDEYGESDGQYIWIDEDNNEKCIIEFVYEDGNLPEEIQDSYDYGNINWEGLNLSASIKSIKQIEYGDLIVY